MTITLGGDLSGNVVTAGEDKTLTATIVANSVQDSMLNTDVKLSSLHDVESFAGGGVDDGKGLTVKADGTLEWTSKTEWDHNLLTNYNADQHQAWAANVSGQVIHEDNIAGSSGWDTTETAVDNADATYAVAGDLVEWGNSGVLSTSGTVTAGVVSTASVTSAADITLDPAGNDVIVSIGAHSVTIDENGITASSGAGMSLTNFTTDGGVLA
jgi:hypothetical protein